MNSIEEDTPSAVPLNNVGAGSVEGIGVGPRGEPGVNPKKKKLRLMFPMMKRKSLSDITKGKM